MVQSLYTGLPLYKGDNLYKSNKKANVLFCEGDPVVQSLYTGPVLYKGGNLYKPIRQGFLLGNKQYCLLIGQEVMF